MNYKDAETRQYFENLPEPSLAETVIGLATVGLALWGMKKISDSCNPNEKKETWMEWITRGLQKSD